MKRSRLRRRSPLKPGGYIKRKTRLRARSPKRRPTSPEDRERLEWLHGLRCCAPGLWEVPHSCDGEIEVHHDTHQRGLGQKSPHSRGMPLCRGHHRDFHDGTGPFTGWTRERRREWQAEMVARYQALWEQRQSGDSFAAVAF